MSSQKYNPEVMDLEYKVHLLEKALDFDTPDKLTLLTNEKHQLEEAWKLFDKRVFYGPSNLG